MPPALESAVERPPKKRSQFADGFVVGSYFVDAMGRKVSPHELTHLAQEIDPRRIYDCLIDRKASREEIFHLQQRFDWMGIKANLVEREGRLCFALVAGVDKSVDLKQFKNLPLVEEILPLSQPYKLAAKQMKNERSIFECKGQLIGGAQLAVMAGPCSIESEEQIFACAQIVKENGGNILRGGAFKPRTSPYAFQGLGEKGLIYLKKAGEAHGLLTVSEVMDTDQIELVAVIRDILQIGARNMQNFSLLKKLGSVKNPILLKRGFPPPIKISSCQPNISSMPAIPT